MNRRDFFKVALGGAAVAAVAVKAETLLVQDPDTFTYTEIVRTPFGFSGAGPLYTAPNKSLRVRYSRKDGSDRTIQFRDFVYRPTDEEEDRFLMDYLVRRNDLGVASYVSPAGDREPRFFRERNLRDLNMKAMWVREGGYNGPGA